MYQMDQHIVFRNPDTGKRYQLLMVSSIEIEKTVENLVDVARIILPEGIMNQVLQIESKVSRGTEVTIKMGYNGSLRTEFVGYVTELKTDDGSLTILCEDALFLFRKAVKNEVLKPTSVGGVAGSLVAQLDPTFKVVCDYDLGYEKFTIHQATGYDVLKKLQEETKANIYFNTELKELHIHPPFLAKGGEVKYATNRNIESVSLEYKRAIDRKFEITVESIGPDGKVRSVKAGSTGGETVNIKTGAMSEADMKKIADAELSKRGSDRLEGPITTWFIPYVEPGYTARYDDPDYPEKKGAYYVNAVTTSFSDAGIVRTIQFGIKLG